LKHAIAIGEGSPMLNVLSRDIPLALFDMLFATKGGSGT
jgi:hypothetical protein